MRGEVENLRGALGYCLDTSGEGRAGLRLAGALYYFWFGGEAREGRYWLERALAAEPGPSRERVPALAAYSRILVLQGLDAEVAAPAAECVELARRFGEPFYEFDALHVLGLSIVLCNRPEAALPLLEQSVELASRLGEAYPAAMAFAKLHLASALLFSGDPAQAAELAAESAAICRAHGDRWYLGFVLGMSVTAALALGDVARAAGYARESLQIGRVLRDPQVALATLEYLARVVATERDHPRAARLLGAAARGWHDIGGSPMVGPWAQYHQQCEADTREALGAATYDVEFDRGCELTLDDAVAYALGERPGPDRGTAERGAAEHGASDRRSDLPRLTRREREIAELVAQGLSNRQIAERLVISTRTAETHVENVLSKLGFTSRTQIATLFVQDDT
jgi:non-specific serine/threonine protein kinase